MFEKVTPTFAKVMCELDPEFTTEREELYKQWNEMVAQRNQELRQLATKLVNQPIPFHLYEVPEL